MSDTVVDGLLKSIVYIDLIGPDEKAAERRLLDGLKGSRGKPVERPSFPGVAATPHAFTSAGRPAQTPATHQGYMPTIRGATADLERRCFMRKYQRCH